MSDKISISFGAMAPSINEQLDYILPERVAEIFEASHQCVNYLRIQGFATRAESAKIEQRLFKEITKAVEAAEANQ